MFAIKLLSAMSWLTIILGIGAAGLLLYFRKLLPIWAWVALVAGVLLTAQFFHTKSVEAKYDKTIQDVAEKTQKAQEALIAYQGAVRASEQSLKSGFEIRIKEKMNELKKIQELHAAAKSNVDSMRNQSERIIAQYDPSNRNTDVATNFQASYEAIRVYAGLFNEANSFATEVAKFAEQSYSAASACAADYEHAKREIELFNKAHQPARLPQAAAAP